MSPIEGNPHRFIDNLTPHLKDHLGIQEVEWFICSHYHDDHMAGYPCLRARYGTKIATSRELVDILEHPEMYDMPCLLPEGVEVSQVAECGKPFEWRGIEFYFDQQPGQTVYSQLIAFEVDNRKFLVIGDRISGMSLSENRDHIYSFIPKNRTPLCRYSGMPAQILKCPPDFMLTGHGGAIPFDKEMMQRWSAWMTEWQGLLETILGQPEADMGVDPHWIEFYPYKVRIQSGDTVGFKVTVTNYETHKSSCALYFRSIAGVKVTPERIEIDIGVKMKGVVEIDVEFPTTFESHSFPIVADVTWNGCHLGEIAEAIAYW